MKKSQLMLKIQNSIEVFENPIFGQIRMVMVDDEPMFCLIDVCRALEIKNATDVAKRLDEDELTRLNLGGRAGE
jgi:prophage antirepressor-like protein